MKNYHALEILTKTRHIYITYNIDTVEKLIPKTDNMSLLYYFNGNFHYNFINF